MLPPRSIAEMLETSSVLAFTREAVGVALTHPTRAHAIDTGACHRIAAKSLVAGRSVWTIARQTARAPAAIPQRLTHLRRFVADETRRGVAERETPLHRVARLSWHVAHEVGKRSACWLPTAEKLDADRPRRAHIHRWIAGSTRRHDAPTHAATAREVLRTTGARNAHVGTFDVSAALPLACRSPLAHRGATSADAGSRALVRAEALTVGVAHGAERHRSPTGARTRRHGRRAVIAPPSVRTLRRKPARSPDGHRPREGTAAALLQIMLFREAPGGDPVETGLCRGSVEANTPRAHEA